jgi:hypothetical protein
VLVEPLVHGEHRADDTFDEWVHDIHPDCGEDVLEKESEPVRRR